MQLETNRLDPENSAESGRTKDTDTDVKEKDNDYNESLKQAINHIVSLASDMDDDGKEKLDRSMTNRVLNRSKHSNLRYSITRTQLIPQTHKEDWEQAKERNPTISGKGLAYTFLWMTDAYHLIRAVNDEGLDAVLVEAFGEFPSFEGTAVRGIGVEDKYINPFRLFESFTTNPRL